MKTIEFDAVYGCAGGEACGSHYVEGKIEYEPADVDGNEFEARLILVSDGLFPDKVRDYVSEMLENAGRIFSGYEYDLFIGRKGNKNKLIFKPIDGFEPYDPRAEPEYMEDR